MEAKFANDTMVSMLCPSGKNNLYLQTQNMCFAKNNPRWPKQRGTLSWRRRPMTQRFGIFSEKNFLFTFPWEFKSYYRPKVLTYYSEPRWTQRRLKQRWLTSCKRRRWTRGSRKRKCRLELDLIVNVDPGVLRILERYEIWRWKLLRESSRLRSRNKKSRGRRRSWTARWVFS